MIPAATRSKSDTPFGSNIVEATPLTKKNIMLASGRDSLEILRVEKPAGDRNCYLAIAVVP